YRVVDPIWQYDEPMGDRRSGEWRDVRDRPRAVQPGGDAWGLRVNGREGLRDLGIDDGHGHDELHAGARRDGAAAERVLRASVSGGIGSLRDAVRAQQLRGQL